MAKVDLRMQFNDQCFLIQNSGIAHKAITLIKRQTNAPPDAPVTHGPVNAEEPLDPGAIRMSMPNPDSYTKERQNDQEVREALKKAEERQANQDAQSAASNKDNFVIYTGADVLPADATSNVVTPDPAHIFHNYFDSFLR